MLHAMAVLKNHVAVAALVLIQKTLFGASQPLPVGIVGEDEHVFDPAIDQVDTFDKIHLPGFAQFLKDTGRDDRQFVSRLKDPPVFH